MQTFQQTPEVSQGFKAQPLEPFPNSLGIDVYVTKAAEKGEGGSLVALPLRALK